MAKTSISTLEKYKQEKTKIAAITAYDASFATTFDKAGVDIILIGDSLGMVIKGDLDTLKVTVADICYHTKCVSAGTKDAFIIADMPFMSYSTPEQALENAAELMRSGSQMVKLEGGAWIAPTVKLLRQNGIPICGHLGLTPQSVNVFGGFKIQGRTEDAANIIYDDAIALEKAGAQLLVLECIPAALAKKISNSLTIPVIGIGAGVDTDGQILVMQDILGITSGYIPKFSKNYLQTTNNIKTAIETYVLEVRAGTFPDPEHILI